MHDVEAIITSTKRARSLTTIVEGILYGNYRFMKEYLPLGSIVILVDGEKKIMIYGRRQLAVKNQQIYDYVACLYPEGNISEEYTYLFNHSDIKEIIFRGYSDADEEKFMAYMGTLDAPSSGK